MLQVQQWKTIQEFERDEQQKYLMFARLKHNSNRIWRLSVLSIVLMMLDIEVSFVSMTTSGFMLKNFVIPKCWIHYKGHDLIEWKDYTHSAILELLSGNDSFMKLPMNSDEESFIRNQVYLTELETGFGSTLLGVITPLWTRRREKLSFHPIYKENINNNNSMLHNDQHYGNFSKSKAYWMIVVIRGLLSATTFVSMYYMILYYNDLRDLYISKRRLPKDAKVYKCALIRPLLFDSLITLPHVPPIMVPSVLNLTATVPLQLCVFLRAQHIIKYLREHHPMRYNRMAEILCILSSIRLCAKFLLKTSFLKTPLEAIISLYATTAFIMSYSIYVIERTVVSGACLYYQDALWLVLVTTTNLGYGDVTVGSGYSRILLQLTSILGMIMMALLVNYISSVLVLPSDERRIVGFFDQYRTIQLKRVAAANLIKSRWKLYQSQSSLSHAKLLRYENSGKNSGEVFQTHVGTAGGRIEMQSFKK